MNVSQKHELILYHWLFAWVHKEISVVNTAKQAKMEVRPASGLALYVP